MPALMEGTHQRRTRKNMMEAMSKRDYIIGAREPIGGDKSYKRTREARVKEERVLGKEAIVTERVSVQEWNGKQVAEGSRWR